MNSSFLIPNNLIWDKTVSDWEVLTYAAIMSIMPNDSIIKNKIVSFTEITYIILGTVDAKYETKKRYTDCIQSIIDKGFLVGEQIAKGNYLIKKPDYKTTWGAKIYIHEFYAIIQSNFKNKGKIFRLLCWMISTFDKKYKYLLGHATAAYFGEKLGCSERNVYNMYANLRGRNVITIISNSTHKQRLPCLYCHNENAEYLIEHKTEIWDNIKIDMVREDLVGLPF